MWGTGSASREFLFVDDAAEGVVLAAEHYDGGEPVNLGSQPRDADQRPGGPHRRATGFEGEVRWDATKPDGQPRRRVDASRAENDSGSRPRTAFDEGLRRTVDWYLANRAEAEARQI